MLICSVTTWLLHLKLPKTHLRAVTPSWLAGGFCWPQQDLSPRPSTVCAACFWFHKVFKARWGCRIRPWKGHFMRRVVVSFILLILPLWSFGIFKEKLKLKSLLKLKPALIQVHKRGWGAKSLPLQMGNNPVLCKHLQTFPQAAVGTPFPAAGLEKLLNSGFEDSNLKEQHRKQNLTWLE